MEIIYSSELLAYMKARKKRNISIEVATSNTSDFEVTEIFLRLVNDDFASYLKGKQYRSIQTDVGEVLLPPYRMHYEKTIRLGLKKHLFFHSITAEGVSL